jgi:putative membrane protein
MTGHPDEAHWQRLAPLALVFLVLRGTQKFVRENLFLFVGAGAGAAFTEWLGARELLLAALAVLLMIIASAVIYHRRFRFRLDGDAVRLRQGVFERKELRVRFSRVQNVQLEQPFYFRPFDLVRFSLETPGAVQTEVELPGIPRGVAEHMRDCILGARDARPSGRAGSIGDTSEGEAEGGAHGAGQGMVGDDGPAAGTARSAGVLFEPSSARLFLHGVSSNQIWVLAGVLVYVFDLLLRNFAESPLLAAFKARLDASAATGWLQPVAVLGALLLLLFLLSGLLAVIRFHRYRLQDQGARLVGRSGLLERREQTLRRDKITGLMLRQSPIGRLLGCWVLLARQTRSGQWESGSGQGRFMVPGLRAQNLVLGASLVAGANGIPRLAPIDAGFRRVLWLRWLLAASVLLALLVYTLGRHHGGVYLTTAALAVLLAAIHLRWRHWGWQQQGRLLWLRRGLLGQRIDVFDMTQAQQVGVTQSPYQRRHDLANLQITLPQGAITVPFLPLQTAARLANQALHAAETATRHRL